MDDVSHTITASLTLHTCLYFTHFESNLNHKMSGLALWVRQRSAGEQSTIIWRHLSLSLEFLEHTRHMVVKEVPHH
jgi:hypothetical protein